MVQKVPFWQFFRKNWDGCALLVQPQKVIMAIEKLFLFWVPMNTYLERLEGRIRDGIFFCVNKSDN